MPHIHDWTVLLPMGALLYLFVALFRGIRDSLRRPR
jgi:hypothetical protein